MRPTDPAGWPRDKHVAARAADARARNTTQKPILETRPPARGSKIGPGFRPRNEPQKGDARQWGITFLRLVSGPEHGSKNEAVFLTNSQKKTKGRHALGAVPSRPALNILRQFLLRSSLERMIRRIPRYPPTSAPRATGGRAYLGCVALFGISALLFVG